MKRRHLILSAMLSVAVTGAALASGLPGRLLAHRVGLPSAATLGLDATQTTVYAGLQNHQRAFRRATYAAIGSLLDDAHVELSSDSVDIAALSAEVDRTLLAIVIESRSLKNERINFYQSLNGEQKARVNAALLQRLERLQRAHAALGDFLIEQP